jgi:Flp pilus assembly protein TadD
MVDSPDTYSEAVRAIIRARGPLSDAMLLRCLVARDRIARDIRAGRLVDLRLLETVAHADDQLRALAPRLAVAPQLGDLRASLNPSPEAWWWYPEIPQPAGTGKLLHALVPAGIVILNAATLALLLDISGRFFYEGIDFIGALTIIIPAVLALAATDGSLRKALSQAIDRLLPTNASGAEISRHRLILALIGLFLAAVFWFSLPAFSRKYNEWGSQHAAHGELAAARQDLERAVRLDPTNWIAHYNLGSVRERLLVWDDAIKSYRIAVEAGYLPAINNLAHLYLVRQDYVEATRVLVPTQPMLQRADASIEPWIRYTLLKNLGWARLGLNRYAEALGVLQQAVSLNPKPAAAHCLLGQLYIETGDRNAARAAWQRCRAQALLDDIDDDMWVAQAARYLDPPSAVSHP